MSVNYFELGNILPSRLDPILNRPTCEKIYFDDIGDTRVVHNTINIDQLGTLFVYFGQIGRKHYFV